MSATNVKPAGFKASYTLGGLEDPVLLDAITECIHQNPAFAGQHGKYIKCACKCFADGALQPLTQRSPAHA